jgi:hypothetical protein
MGWDEDIAIEKGMEVDHHNAMIVERDAEIQRLRTELTDVRVTNAKNSEDASILLAMVQHFHTLTLDRSQHQDFVDAVQYAIDDTGISVSDMLDHITRLGFDVDENDFVRDWIVTIVVPVTICLTVEAANADDAESLAIEEVDCNGIDNYHMDYNLHYDGEVTDVEEAY